MKSSMFSFSVNSARCTGCGLCVNECVYDAIEMGQDKLPQPALHAEEKCILCQHCMTVCPTGACSVGGLDQEASEKTSPPDPDLYPKIRDLLHARRSIRHYKQENVDLSILEELLNEMKHVPTGVNFRHLSFTVIQDIQAMNRYRNQLYLKIQELCRDYPDDPRYKPFASYPELYFEKGKDVVFRTAPHMILAGSPSEAPCGDVDPLIALSQFEVLACARGLGTVWCGRIMNIFKAIPELQNDVRLPDGGIIRYAMLFGIPEWTHCRTSQPDTPKIHWIG